MKYKYVIKVKFRKIEFERWHVYNDKQLFEALKIIIGDIMIPDVSLTIEMREVDEKEGSIVTIERGELDEQE